MRFSEFIESNQVFTTEQAMTAVGERQNTSNMLYLATKTNRIRRVRRGLYVSNSGKFNGREPSPFKIASAIPGAVMCHSSAFSLFVGAQDISREVTFYVASQIRGFEFDGHAYRPVKKAERSYETKPYRLLDGTEIMGTTKEQTIVDALSDPTLSGGVEAVLRRLSMVQFADFDKIVALSEKAGASCCARIGWALRHQSEWAAGEDMLSRLKSKISLGPYYLGSKKPGMHYDPEWHLYLPENPQTMESWLNG